MSVIPADQLFGESQSIAASASAAVISTNTLYVPQGKNHLGTAQNPSPFNSGKCFLHIRCEDTALAGSGGAATVNINVKNKASASSMGSGTTILNKAITADASGANYPDGAKIWDVGLPVAQLLPYLAIQFAVTGNKLAGAVTAWIDSVPTQS